MLWWIPPAFAACLGVPPCEEPRSVTVDWGALGVGPMRGEEQLQYDHAELAGRVRLAELPTESELSVAVRLIISEVGADRLLHNTQGWLEAVGILYTVDNRLDPARWNPEDRPHAQAWPGCGPEGTFTTCANPGQYHGLKSWRALDPIRRYDPALLDRAIELAVQAWWAQEHGFVTDITGGATHYVHRCGGAAYGETTHHCDGHMGRPERDIPGADPHTGPLVFKSPRRWDAARGIYRLGVSAIVDFATR